MRKIKRIIFTAMLIFWMAVIFGFSAKEADESTDMSLKAGMMVGSIFVPGFETWGIQKQEAFAEKIDHPVRKCAHATEYALLGILWMLTLGAFEVSMIRRWWISWLLSALYASGDELHQMFVPGRSCQLKDVLIDSGGAIAGIFVTILISVCVKKLLLKRQKFSL